MKNLNNSYFLRLNLLGIETCEDIVIHHRTGHAFMACGDKTIRSQVFYPPINLITDTTQLIRDTPYIYDINVCILSIIIFLFFLS